MIEGNVRDREWNERERGREGEQRERLERSAKKRKKNFSPIV